MSDRLANILIPTGIIVTVLGILFVIVSLFSSYNSDKTKDCTVFSKENVTKVTNGSSSNEKRVYTEDCGVFTVNDSITKGTFRSGDLYGSLKENHRYTLTYNGWRIGITSSFPNITKAVEVK